jgi:hypothetical protein
MKSAQNLGIGKLKHLYFELVKIEMRPSKRRCVVLLEDGSRKCGDHWRRSVRTGRRDNSPQGWL